MFKVDESIKCLLGYREKKELGLYGYVKEDVAKDKSGRVAGGSE